MKLRCQVVCSRFAQGRDGRTQLRYIGCRSKVFALQLFDKTAAFTLD